MLGSDPKARGLQPVVQEVHMDDLFFVGRLIFGGFFIYNGINHFKQRKELADYAGAKKVPLPNAAVTATGAACPRASRTSC